MKMVGGEMTNTRRTDDAPLLNHAWNKMTYRNFLKPAFASGLLTGFIVIPVVLLFIRPFLLYSDPVSVLFAMLFSGVFLSIFFLIVDQAVYSGSDYRYFYMTEDTEKKKGELIKLLKKSEFKNIEDYPFLITINDIGLRIRFGYVNKSNIFMPSLSNIKGDGFILVCRAGSSRRKFVLGLIDQIFNNPKL